MRRKIYSNQLEIFYCWNLMAFMRVLVYFIDSWWKT